MPALKNPKHEKFVQNVAKGMSGAKAYLAAGYNSNDNAANVAATRLLKQPNVRARLSELLDRRDLIEVQATQKAVEKLALTKEAVLAELAKIGFANMLDYIRTTDRGDAYVDLSALNRDQAAAIVEMTVDEYTEGRGEDARNVKRVKFKLADKKGALVDIGKALGMFVDRKEIGGPGDFAAMTSDELRASITRDLATLGIENQVAQDQGRGRTPGSKLN